MLEGAAAVVTVFAGLAAFSTVLQKDVDGKGATYMAFYRLTALLVAVANLYTGLRVFL